MLRIVKGLVIAFAISFLIVIPTVAAQAAESGPSDPTTTSTIAPAPVAEYAPTADNPGKSFLTDEQKADIKSKAELDRQQSIHEWEVVSTVSLLFVVGGVAGHTRRDSLRKKR